MIRRVAVCAALALIGCKSEGETTDETIEATGSTKPTGSAGGFSASLSADLARGSDGSAAGSAAPAAGSAAAAMGSGSAAGSGAAAMGSGSAGSAAGSGSAKPMAGSAGGSGSASAPSTGSGAGSAKPAVVVAGSGAGSAKVTPPAAGSAAPVVTAPKGPIKVSAELAAIKLSLLPNWDRDVEAAGTISLAVKVQSRDETAVFTFNYGYDDARAPADREAYKKFLGDSKILTVLADRQRGAAWYLEGTDAAGKPAFRFLVNFGGKRLVCYGSLYKDSGFGDIRDEVIIQAKKICETIQL